MRFSINDVTLLGNLTKNPEKKESKGDFTIVNIGIAVNARVKDKQTDEWIDKPDFLYVTFIGKPAEWALKSGVKTGSKVLIEGRLRMNQWEDKDGIKKSRLEIIGNNLIPMSNVKNTQAAEAQKEMTPDDIAPDKTNDDISSDDIPF